MSDLLALPLKDPAGEPIVVANRSADERNGRFSPDGRWAAYESSDGEGYDVYLQRFPGSAASRLKISTAGGMNPEWSRDGKELYFLSPDYRLMAVTVTFSGETVSLSKPTVLFRLPGGSEYGVSSDRNRFLVYAPTGEANPIIVLSNWAKKN